MKDEGRNILKGYNLLLYFAGSMIMSEPTEDCVMDFWKNGNLRNLPLSSANPRFIAAAGLLRECCPDNVDCIRILSEDYYRLFALSGLPLAPAYASIYHKDGGETAYEVSEFYRSYGWEPKLKESADNDHLGVQLLFLTKLIDKYLALDDEPCLIEMKKEITRFIDNHIMSWISEWYNDVEEHAHSMCYKGIGMLILAIIEDLIGILSCSDRELK